MKKPTFFLTQHVLVHVNTINEATFLKDSNVHVYNNPKGLKID